MPCGVFAYDCGGARMLFDLCFSGLRLWIGFQIGDLCLPIVRCFLLCDGLSFPSTFDSLVPQICEYLTSRSAHAIDITREAIRQGADAVIAVGGDGTLHEVVAGAREALLFGSGVVYMCILYEPITFFLTKRYKLLSETAVLSQRPRRSG